MNESSKKRLVAYAAANNVNLNALEALVEDIVTNEQHDVIALLGARLDQMKASYPLAQGDSWASAYDAGWSSARAQIGRNILNPTVQKNIRAGMER